MAAFSRLQLAAALIEYDNDINNPTAPFRSAHDSAIFAHLRRNVGLKPSLAHRKSSDYLGVSMPSETGSLGGRESTLGTRKSRGSLDALRNPFGADDGVEEEDVEEHQNLEVDLASWGLDAFMPKEKDLKGKGKARASTLPLQNAASLNDTIPRPLSGRRTMSLGNMDGVVANELSEEPSTSDHLRRRSFGTPLDLDGVEAAFETSAHTSPLDEKAQPQMIPFPTRSTSPANDLNRASESNDVPRQSTITAIPPHLIDIDNPFALSPPTNASRFDPKAALKARTISNASMGTRMMLDNEDGMSTMNGQLSRGRPYSTMELLRPKVLVMPSPLQSVPPPAQPSPIKAREGFELSTDGPPLPPGARTVRRTTVLDPPIASNSFTPNPRASLTLSQLTFRNQLTVGGQRDVAYADLDSALPRATEEGVQVSTTEDIPPDVPLPPDDSTTRGRPAGKLFGKSLIDDLEMRKSQMRNKQRVFYGDQRPSMMARGQVQRPTTFIDPASLQSGPATERQSAFGVPTPSDGLIRRNSAVKPLLNFDNEALNPPPGPKVLKSRSVFGVDMLWESEMEKLREIEEREKAEAEERERLEAAKGKHKGKGGKKKSKAQVAKDEVPSPVVDSEIAASPPLARVSAEPPKLPDIPKAVRGPPPPHLASDSDSDASDDEVVANKLDATGQTEGWYAGSSDEEGKEKSSAIRVGTGPRYRSSSTGAPMLPGLHGDDSDDEDLPLAAALDRVVRRVSQRRAADSDSDEDTPLAAVLTKSQLGSPTRSRKPSAADDDDDDEDDEDNEPLGLRASRIPAGAGVGNDDDTPLAFHPEQQRRTQYQMLAQAQAQHQQLMMHAQATNSMFFNPSMMGSGFFGPQIAAPPPMMMMPPVPIPSPPPLNDATKFGRVDRWRRDVAVEGGQ